MDVYGLLGDLVQPQCPDDDSVIRGGLRGPQVEGELPHSPSGRGDFQEHYVSETRNTMQKHHEHHFCSHKKMEINIFYLFKK